MNNLRLNIDRMEGSVTIDTPYVYATNVVNKNDPQIKFGKYEVGASFHTVTVENHTVLELNLIISKYGGNVEELDFCSGYLLLLLDNKTRIKVAIDGSECESHMFLDGYYSRSISKCSINIGQLEALCNSHKIEGRLTSGNYTYDFSFNELISSSRLIWHGCIDNTKYKEYRTFKPSQTNSYFKSIKIDSFAKLSHEKKALLEKFPAWNQHCNLQKYNTEENRWARICSGVKFSKEEFLIYGTTQDGYINKIIHWHSSNLYYDCGKIGCWGNSSIIINLENNTILISDRDNLLRLEKYDIQDVVTGNTSLGGIIGNAIGRKIGEKIFSNSYLSSKMDQFEENCKQRHGVEDIVVGDDGMRYFDIETSNYSLHDLPSYMNAENAEEFEDEYDYEEPLSVENKNADVTATASSLVSTHQSQHDGSDEADQQVEEDCATSKIIQEKEVETTNKVQSLVETTEEEDIETSTEVLDFEESHTMRNSIILIVLFLIVGMGAYYVLNQGFGEKTALAEPEYFDDTSEDENVLVYDGPMDDFYGDGINYDVRGHVLSLGEIYFNPDGTVVMDENLIYRDNNGRLTGMMYNFNMGSQTIYEYFPNGKLKGEATSGGDGLCGYEYDKNGYQLTMGTYDDDTNEFERKGTYSYISFDSHGNWLERTNGYGNKEKRTIVYWSDKIESDFKISLQKQARKIYEAFCDTYNSGDNTADFNKYLSTTAQEIQDALLEKEKDLESILCTTRFWGEIGADMGTIRLKNISMESFSLSDAKILVEIQNNCEMEEVTNITKVTAHFIYEDNEWLVRDVEWDGKSAIANMISEIKSH